MGRRSRDEGSIYQDADGRWRASLSLGYVGGKRKRKLFSGATQAEVRKQLLKARRDLQLEGRRVDLDERCTTEKFLEKWLAHLEGKVKRRTLAAYKTHVKKNINPILGSIRVTKLRPMHVQLLIDEMAKARRNGKPPRANTLRNARAALRRAFGWGVEQELLSQNVARCSVVYPKETPFKGRKLTLDEARRFLAAAKGTRLEALWILLMTAAVREGEALGLTWSYIDFDGGESGTLIVIRELYRATKIGFTFDEPKSEKSRRTLPLPAITRDALKDHLHRQKVERLAMGSAWKELPGFEGLVFTNLHGGPIDVSDLLKKDWPSLLAAAKIEGPCRIHDLRGSCATLLLAAGVPIETISKVLGHADIGVTLRAYADVLPELLEKAARTANALFG
jgi:integrase